MEDAPLALLPLGLSGIARRGVREWELLAFMLRFPYFGFEVSDDKCELYRVFFPGRLPVHCWFLC